MLSVTDIEWIFMQEGDLAIPPSRHRCYECSTVVHQVLYVPERIHLVICSMEISSIPLPHHEN